LPGGAPHNKEFSEMRPSHLLHGIQRRIHPAAFTLVELLVVIGIIAVMIAILLPTHAKARESANRAVCLSNMRELSNSLRIYATTFKDQIPIGYMDQQNFNWFVNWNNGNGTKVSLLGLLAISKLTPNPKVFYCPDVQDDQFRYNTPENPWPPFEKWPDSPRFTTPGLGHTRITYQVRPIANWPPEPVSAASIATYGDSVRWIPYLGTNWTGRSSSARLTIAMPKLSKLKNKAIITDLMVSSYDVARTHKTGINVMYASGGGQWVDLTRVMNKLVQAPPGGSWADDEFWRRWRLQIPDGNGAYGSPSVYNDIFLVEPNFYGGSSGLAIPVSKQPCGIWVNLDHLSK
jgi:prepilin-type N-terminal cleavage/methylation domain-containing protein